MRYKHILNKALLCLSLVVFVVCFTVLLTNTTSRKTHISIPQETVKPIQEPEVKEPVYVLPPKPTVAPAPNPIQTIVPAQKPVSVSNTPNILTPITEIVSEYPEGGMAIPAWSQGDPRWGTLMYDTKTIKASGCGPTSSAMVVTALTHSIVYPNQLAQFFNDFYIQNKGSDHALFSAVAQFYGLRCIEIEHTKEAMLKNLNDNKPIIARVQGGALSGGGGHFLVLRGLSSDGKIYMNDPGNSSNTTILWEADYILKYSTKFFAFEEDA